jgi:hypothetical protein
MRVIPVLCNDMDKQHRRGWCLRHLHSQRRTSLTIPPHVDVLGVTLIFHGMLRQLLIAIQGCLLQLTRCNQPLASGNFLA